MPGYHDAQPINYVVGAACFAPLVIFIVLASIWEWRKTDSRGGSNMERLTKTIYVSNDGKEFDSAADCEKHEKKIKDRKALTTYWSVSHSPDLTEGRGWQGLYLVECYGPKIDARTWIEDWCYRKFGRPLAFVQGVSPMANWIVSQINENQFRLDQKAYIGDQTFGAKRIRLVAGSLEAGLIEGVLEGDK